MSPLFISTMRTVVPLVAGWLLSLAAWAGFSVESEQAVSAVTLVLALAYYVLFRALEFVGTKLRGTALQKMAGVLLGWARPPAYPDAGGALPPVATYTSGPRTR